MDKNSKIYVAGHRGLAGSAIVRKLQADGYNDIIFKTREELDLLDQEATRVFFEQERPEYVFLAAAKVGGVMANKTQKADFIYQNLQIQNNIIYNAHRYGVKKLLFLGSSCIYPKACPQPIKEKYLMTGSLEETSDAYALAKIAGIKMCQSFNEQYGTNYISVMPANLYGPNDNFDKNNSHVLQALMRKFYEAKINNEKEVVLWGTGSPLREFLYVDDMADAVVFLMNNYDGSEIHNIGTGGDVAIKELAEKIKDLVKYEGEIKWDVSKPDGVPRKLLDVSKINKFGWKYKTELNDGLKKVFEWFMVNYENIK
ncbi:MAG: GDP-fucose synthetase [Candidatus Moranbacteria bacterium CG_4_9_14_3_um_filter_36_9]|nr:MAG: GDP-fucose synthetase [Candidatus Moranbacteria bacterium CG_4_9_14_3_um_filter_36_9]